MMTNENGIPEYALQPARAPKLIGAEAIYHTEKMIYPAEKKQMLYQFEEDVLVPDTKADMREILFMDAVCDVLPTEKKVLPKTDDLMNLTGVVSVQTVYSPDGEEKMPVSISSKIPYKYQWSLNPKEPGEGVFSCEIKSIEHMIINERKFRVKVTLLFHAQLYGQKEFTFFDGLKDESLEMKSEEMQLTCLAVVKRDEISIDEHFHVREMERTPEHILKQCFVITENYRQVTTEKVVINGFIFVNLLYTAKGDHEKPSSLCQHHQRIEFTQFIPIEKEQRGKKWCAVKPSFTARNLMVTVDKHDEEHESASFHIKGDIETRVELYEARKQDMVVDAYHREKQFSCQYHRNTFLNVGESAISEISAREVISLPEKSKAVEAVYCSSRLIAYDGAAEKGKYYLKGDVLSTCLWKDGENNYHTIKEVSTFHTGVDMEKMEKDTVAECRPVLKSCSISLINEKQLELNYTLLLCCDSYEEKEIILLDAPGFIEGIREKEYPMAVVTMQEGECLWDLAKRYRTTEERIKEINRLDMQPVPGQKLLMVK